MVRDARFARVVVRSIERSLLSASRLVELADLSYDALASWRAERRSPTPDAAARVADVLDAHALVLQKAAAEIRKELERAR